MFRSVSIIICTCNRAESLRSTLEAIGRVRVPDHVSAELLVVDNASTDATRDIVHAAALTNLPVSYTYEPRPGKTGACNRSIHESTHELLLYTDDDVRPDGDWLRAHLHAYDDPRVGAVQGRSHVTFATDPPAWYDPRQHGAPGSVDCGPEVIFPWDRPLVGVNFSVRRSVALEIGGFNTMLGPGRAGFYDDDDFSVRLRRAGHLQKYEPAAVVEHCVLGDRITLAGRRREAFRLGASFHVATRFYGTGKSERPYRDLARASWRRLKMEIKHLLRRDRAVLPQTERFHLMAAGAAWAALQSRRRLLKRYGGDGSSDAAPADQPAIAHPLSTSETSP